MPTTPRGLTYPDATGHTRLWEHLQTLATTADTAIDTVDDKIEGAWTAYTPTWAANTTNPTGTSVAAFKQVGKTVHFRILYTITTPGSGTYTVTLPVPPAAAANFLPYGFGVANPGGTVRTLTANGNGAGSTMRLSRGDTGASLDHTGFVTGNVIGVAGSYEAA